MASMASAPTSLREAADALASVSESDKWLTLKVILLFNAVLGFGFFIGTLFLDSRWGSGASFQAVFTAMIHEAYTLYVLNLVNRQDIRHADFLGGVNVMMNVLLLQTAALWGDFANGLQMSYGNICIIDGSASERFVSVITTLLFLVHLALTGLVIFWKQDLLRGVSSRGHQHQAPDYEAVQSPIGAGSLGQSYQNGLSPGGRGSTRPKQQFVIDDDDEDADAEL
ncbi:Hypothetical Protein FCC1311_022272 [Hondaea fermentalgiana]|uniref:Uncharacterized protein n=1 Tax=Hondaea fermentalgiana TaxID=2315210 RepID=A0A2R5G4Q2_9STRA|nr:Hypothetical Protein FCC1311_022272 [Hondaea fermentalgiana]|eukprot:GBG26007.1 Hypothetical Protein FCC1311_022272 [Hondaea fermentalgiana]